MGNLNRKNVEKTLMNEDCTYRKAFRKSASRNAGNKLVPDEFEGAESKADSPMN